MKTLKQLKAPIVIVTALMALIACGISSQQNQADDYLNFPEKLSSATPYDVDTVLEHKLQGEKKFDETQRIFEVLSWQMFISLNWPVDGKGQPKPEITDEGTRIWDYWKESYEIFRENGGKPKGWGSKTDLPEELVDKVKGHEDEELLFRTSKFSSFKNEKWDKQHGRKAFAQHEEVDQAFTSPIWDQSGNIVRYEIRLNKPTVDYIVNNELYNFDGQIAFSTAKKTVSFPSSSVAKPGSIELKFAWKIIVPGKDDKERYYTKKVMVLDSNQKTREVIVGLVGMHIGIKTLSSPQWIWATFEQVDNVETNTLTKVNGHYLKPSFNDPDCTTCPVNLYPTDKPQKNQIQRIMPIPMATQELNKQVQGILKAKNSFWQYYQLIGTQWPTEPSAAPYPLNSAVYKLPDAVTNKSGGKPTPTFLTNMVMETYFQGGTNIDSTSHYNIYIANEPARFQIEGVPTNDPKNTGKMIFGTEGCVNCHSSASIATGVTIDSTGKKSPVFGPPRTSDFEWLLQRKANFKTMKTLSKTIKSK